MDLFFVISGYVIAGSALRQKNSGNFSRRYWTARLARIVPLYYITLFAYIALVPTATGSGYAASDVIGHLLFLHTFHPDSTFSINGVTWSLGIEMQFYLLAFLAVPLMARWPARRLAIGYLALLAGVLTFRMMAWQITHRPDAANDTHVLNALAQAPALLDSFALGVLIQLLGVKLSVRRGVALLLLSIILAVAINRYYVAKASIYLDSRGISTFFRTGVALWAAIMLVAVLSFRQKAAAVFRPLVWMGKISYGIYLWHLTVLFTLQAHLPLQGTWAVVAIVATTLVLAELSYRAIEHPFVLLGHRLSRPATRSA